MAKQTNLHCSFCGRSRDEVKILIAGQESHICENCVEHAQEIIGQELVGTEEQNTSTQNFKLTVRKPTEIKKFLDGTKPKNIFVMGDFNDRYDAIKDITVNGMKLTYEGDSPYSCCHNWDSSCKNERYNKFDDKY